MFDEDEYLARQRSLTAAQIACVVMYGFLLALICIGVVASAVVALLR